MSKSVIVISFYEDRFQLGKHKAVSITIRELHTPTKAIVVLLEFAQHLKYVAACCVAR